MTTPHEILIATLEPSGLGSDMAAQSGPHDGGEARRARTGSKGIPPRNLGTQPKLGSAAMVLPKPDIFNIEYKYSVSITYYIIYIGIRYQRFVSILNISLNICISFPHNEH